MKSLHFSNDELKCRHCDLNACRPELLCALEFLRYIVGKPVIVNSAFRCVEHNRAVGGARNSAHVRGLAADVRVDGMTAADLERAARSVACITGIGRADHQGYIHIDVRSDGPAEWCYDAQGKTVAYFPPQGDQTV